MKPQGHQKRVFPVQHLVRVEATAISLLQPERWVWSDSWS